MPLFKTRLRVLRAEREWTQAELAAYVGVTRQTINSIEKGRFHPNLQLAFKIESRMCLSTMTFELRPSA
jgi:putative transcriptional regulator